MSRLTIRHDGLARLLDAPNLPERVARLAPESLHRLIRANGLEACGPLIAVATVEQIASVLDLDLWNTTSGHDDQFDEQRFAAWIEMLADADPGVAARVIAGLDVGLVVTGLSRHIRVFDPAVLSPLVSDDEVSTRASGDLDAEVGGYVIESRGTDAWDAIVRLLLTLDSDHGDCFHALMQGCRRLSNSTPERDGLDDLPLAAEQMLEDERLARDDRRSRQGYVTAGDARAFLGLARNRPLARPDLAGSANVIAARYLHGSDEPASSGARQPLAGVLPAGAPPDGNAPASLDDDLSIDLEPAPAQPKALPGAVSGALPPTPIERLMARLSSGDAPVHAARTRELAFLVNALLSGCSVYGRTMTPDEALQAAAGACHLGMEMRFGPLGEIRPADGDLIGAFEAGWALLHEQVGLFAARRLLSVLDAVRSVDATTERGLRDLRKSLERHLAEGAPWLAQEALDVISTLDLPTWACLLGLLSECPVFPKLLPAVLEKQAASISGTAFDCFATMADVRLARAFAERLEEAMVG
jgi:hypothetical protein